MISKYFIVLSAMVVFIAYFFNVSTSESFFVFANNESKDLKWNLTGTKSILSTIVNDINIKNGISMVDAVIDAQNYMGKGSFVTNSLLTVENGFIVYDIVVMTDNDVRRLLVDAGTGDTISDVPLFYKILAINSNGEMNKSMINPSNATKIVPFSQENAIHTKSIIPFALDYNNTSTLIDIANAIAIAERSYNNTATAIFATLNTNPDSPIYEIYMVDNDQMFYFVKVDANTGKVLIKEIKEKNEFGQTNAILEFNRK